MADIHFATCPLCEATCGLEVTVEGGRVRRIRGDRHHVLSHGYICPKGASLAALHEDPDRLTTPLVKRDGVFHEATWDEAFREIDRRLPDIRQRYGNNAVAVYIGNAFAHNLGTMLYGQQLLATLESQSLYTAGTVDQVPKEFSCGYLFGEGLAVPIADLDRTQFFLLLGANPLVSNGSLLTAPNMRRRLKAIRKRGGRVIVVDPRRTATAEAADQHFAIRPGTDAVLLAALVWVLFDEALVNLRHLEPHVAGVDRVRELVSPFPPEEIASYVGLSASDIRGLARDLAAADSAAVYGRMGTTAQEFGTLASWLIDVLNILTGNLDRAGGVMFPLASASLEYATANKGAFVHGRWHSRVHGMPEVMGELPVATLADEILTPGAGQVRALISIGGNPCVSVPNVHRLSAALAELDFMISMDIYLNETSRHADVILPGPPPFAREHFDYAFQKYSVRNVAHWSAPSLATDMPQEWETLLRLIGILDGQGPDADVAVLDDLAAEEAAERAGVELATVSGRRGPARLVDIMLRGGPYDITLADLEAAPHGVDFGPLTPRLAEVLATESGKIELAAPAITDDIPRLQAALAKPPARFLLIGRRQTSSNNSWMHNLPPLVRGGNRCIAQISSEDAQDLGLSENGRIRITSRTGTITVPVEVTDTVRPGVVTVPHGWGHDEPDTRTRVAHVHAGVNSNILADELLIDAPSGTSAINGIPVDIVAV